VELAVVTAIDELLNGVYSPTVTDVSVLVREVHVRVGVLLKPVVIRVFYDGRAGEPYRFVLSARMKTTPDGDRRPLPRSAASEAEALRRAVRMLMQDYEDAVRQGLMPDDCWLVEDDGRG
jgi:hypothetical protein